jgi:hypothetical protein
VHKTFAAMVEKAKGPDGALDLLALGDEVMAAL